MTKPIHLILALVISIASFAQSFEGEIVYHNVYKSKLPAATDEQFATMLGATLEYFIKGGDYKSVLNGSLIHWQLYVNSDNKLYNKMANLEALLWYDGAENKDSVLKAEVHKGVATIAGYLCDELVLTCTSGMQQYYYATQLGIDPDLYVSHQFGNWYAVVSRTKSLPLKMVVDNAQFTIESTATEVRPMPLDKALFALPPGVETKKSPY